MDNFPADILKNICSFLDIDMLENYYLTNEYLENVLTYDFWKEYFELYNVNIRVKQDQPLSWIYEFKTGKIFEMIPKSLSIRYTSLKISSTDMEFLGFKVDHKYMKIEFAEFIVSYQYINSNFRTFRPRINDECKLLTNYNMLIGNYSDEESSIIIKHGDNGFWVRGFIIDNKTLHQILFTSFENENIIGYNLI